MRDEWIAGRNAVLEALNSGRTISRVLMQEGTAGNVPLKIKAAAAANGVIVEVVAAGSIDKLVQGLRHQGVAALAAPIEFVSLEQVLAKTAKKKKRPFLVLLDELQDPQNVGAVLRSADAAGVDGVLMPKRRSCPLNAAVAKVSAGAVNYVPVVQIGNVVQTLKKLKEKGFWVVGADMDGESMYFEADLTVPLVLVVGAEGKGIGRLVKENCDVLVRMPMYGGVNSLNASAAGAILMYEAVRQRILKEK